MLKFRTPELLLGILLTVAVFAIGMIFSTSYNFQVAADHQSQKAITSVQNNDDSKPIASNSIIAAQEHRHQESVSEFWSAKFADWLLTAFTFFLVLFTYRLWKSTDKLWAAGDKLERPYVYIFGADGLDMESDREDPFYFLKYSIANYGRTPASIESAYVKVSVGVAPELPSPVNAWHDFVISPILIPNARRDTPTVEVPEFIEISEYADEDIPPTPVPALKDRDEFYLWVRIKYRGLFSGGHETSACWRWEGFGLTLHGGEQYNYQT